MLIFLHQVSLIHIKPAILVFNVLFSKWCSSKPFRLRFLIFTIFLKDHPVSTQLLELLCSDSSLVFSADVFQTPTHPLLQLGSTSAAGFAASPPLLQDVSLHWVKGSPHCDRAAHTEEWEWPEELRISSDSFLEMLHFILHHLCDEQKFFHQGSWPWVFSNCDSSQTAQKGPRNHLQLLFPSLFPPPLPFLCNSFLFSQGIPPWSFRDFLGVPPQQPWNKSCLLHLQGWWKL